jgi:hypothetical protein
MLVAEMSDRFRAIFAFGPVEDVRAGAIHLLPTRQSYGADAEIARPIRSAPLFVIEGTGGNIEDLWAMQSKSTNPLVRFVAVPVRSFRHLARKRGCRCEDSRRHRPVRGDYSLGAGVEGQRAMTGSRQRWRSAELVGSSASLCASASFCSHPDPLDVTQFIPSRSTSGDSSCDEVGPIRVESVLTCSVLVSTSPLTSPMQRLLIL